MRPVVCIIVGGLPSVLPRRSHLLLHQCRVCPPSAAEVPVSGEAIVPHWVHLAEHLQDCTLSRASDSWEQLDGSSCNNEWNSGISVVKLGFNGNYDVHLHHLLNLSSLCILLPSSPVSFPFLSTFWRFCAPCWWSPVSVTLVNPSGKQCGGEWLPLTRPMLPL